MARTTRLCQHSVAVRRRSAAKCAAGGHGRFRRFRARCRMHQNHQRRSTSLSKDAGGLLSSANSAKWSGQGRGGQTRMAFRRCRSRLRRVRCWAELVWMMAGQRHITLIKETRAQPGLSLLPWLAVVSSHVSFEIPVCQRWRRSPAGWLQSRTASRTQTCGSDQNVDAAQTFI